MLLEPKALTDGSESAPHEDDRWRLTDLEAAQRRNLYAAGRGDAPRRNRRRRWTKVISKAA